MTTRKRQQGRYSLQGHEVQKRLNAIQGRYAQALKTLATINRLLQPAANPARPTLEVVPREPIAC